MGSSGAGKPTLPAPKGREKESAGPSTWRDLEPGWSKLPKLRIVMGCPGGHQLM